MDIKDADRWREALRAFMKWYGINENQWCKRAGMPQSTLNGFMRGEKNNITYGTLEKLAKSVGVTVGMIMGEVGMRESPAQGFEAAPDNFRKMLGAKDAELVEQILGLDPTQKAILSGTLKALPGEPNNRPQGKTPKTSKGS